MARTSARNVNPNLSSDARDKLLAALNWTIGQSRRSADYLKAPMYFDACLEWMGRSSSLTRDPSWNAVDREDDRAVAAAGLVNVGAEPALEAGATQRAAAGQDEGDREDSRPQCHMTQHRLFWTR
jgi:hypothetical protein